MAAADLAGRDHEHQIDQQLTDARIVDALENLHHAFARRSPTDGSRSSRLRGTVSSATSEGPLPRKNDGRTRSTRPIFRTCSASIRVAPLSKASTSRSVAPMLRAKSYRVRSLKMRVRRKPAADVDVHRIERNRNAWPPERRSDSQLAFHATHARNLLDANAENRFLNMDVS